MQSEAVFENGCEVEDYNDVGRKGPRIVMFSDSDDYKSINSSTFSNDVFSEHRPTTRQLLRQLKHSILLIGTPLAMLPLLFSSYPVRLITIRILEILLLFL